MRILEVNGTSLLGATHQEAVNALREAGDHIQIIVCKGYDKSSLIHSIGSAGGMSTGFNSSTNRLGSRASETGSELSQSVSSLDRDDAIIDDSSRIAAVSICFTHTHIQVLQPALEKEKLIAFFFHRCQTFKPFIAPNAFRHIANHKWSKIKY